MSHFEIPDDIIKRAFVVFRTGPRKNILAALVAMDDFLNHLKDSKTSDKYDKAGLDLSNTKLISGLVAEARKKINKDYINEKDQSDKEFKQMVLDLLDPETNRRTSFGVNVRAGLIFFALSTVVGSPFAAVLLKGPAESFDRWLHNKAKKRLFDLCRTIRNRICESRSWRIIFSKLCSAR